MTAAAILWFFPPNWSNLPSARKALDHLSVPALLVLGAALRWWSPAMKSDLWYDETYSYNVAARPFRTMMAILYRGADTNPPLYTLLLHFWIKFGHSDVHVKLFSLLFGTASIAIFYILSKRIAGRRAALVSCLLFAASQPVITYAVEARPYALFLFLSLLSTHFLLTALEQGRPQRSSSRLAYPWLGYAVASVLVIYTHWFGLLLVLVQLSAFVVYPPHFRQRVRPYVFSLLAIAFCCAPLGPFLWNQVSLQNAVGGYSWPGKPGLRSLGDLAAFLAGGKNLLLVIVVVLVLTYRAKRRRSLEAPPGIHSHASFFIVYLILPVAVVFVTSNLLSSNSFFVHRYFLPFIIGGHILIGFCLSRIDRRAMLILLLGFVAAPLIRTARHWHTPEIPYSQIAQQLPSNFSDEVLIAHLSPMSYYPVRHYRPSLGPRERILWAGPDCCYEVSYNLRAGVLNADELIEIGPELGKYTELWVILDPMDRDKKIPLTHENVRTNSNFVLESEKRIGGLRLEHYTSTTRGANGDRFNTSRQ
jgi:4-amino-4-deoxy-L-arabinose transferase-like glycosyltransferase